ncbi:hypothetical protein HB815_07570 [Listeria booriae]|uniref:WxL domain-containing protein n=1 Tax=Listeria booriae TaxID=1552123 RepID=UPI001624F6F3|nr:WxL domain-containing protein [Listeria booriae]MBC1210783.1 hypothetical protein [Listeria booriae]
MRKKIFAALLVLVLPAPIFANAVSAEVMQAEQQITESQTPASEATSDPPPTTQKSDTDIVLNNDLDEQPTETNKKETTTTARKPLTSTRLTATSSVVQASDLDNQTWLIAEIERQLPGKKVGTTLSFDDLKKITQIQLDGGTAGGHIPAGIQYLTALTNLTLTNMQLSGEIPSSISQLQELTRLNLGTNKITGSIPETIGNLKKLTWMGLSDNQLSGKLPSSIGGLTALATFSIHANQISGPIPSEMGNLKHLYGLYLDNNQLSGPIPSTLANIPTLTNVYLNNNYLTGIIPASLMNLNIFAVYNNQVTLNSANPSPTPADRYVNTFATNSQLAAPSTIAVDSTVIKPFDPKSDTYFNLHYTDNGVTAKTLHTAHNITILNASTNQVIYDGAMNPNVTFNHQEGTTYRVILDNAPANPHNTTTISLNLTELSLLSVPDTLDFGIQGISGVTKIYQRANNDWNITVNDSRNTKQNWTLTAKMTQPMKGTNGRTLSNGLIFRDNNGTETPLSSQSLPVYEYQPNTNTTNTTKVSWAANQGILLKVKSGEAYAQDYQGQVEWSLNDAP